MNAPLDRIEIESVGSDPVALATAVLAQLPGLAPPVPIHDIALTLDIVAIEERPFITLEGCLQTDPLKNLGIIAVNAKSGERRQRFTIAHELGHFLNERHRPTDIGLFKCSAQDMSNPSGEERHIVQEREANQFAIELLAPRSMMTTALNEEPDLTRACALADDLNISREATIRRYAEMHDETLAAVFSQNGKIRYVCKPDNFPNLSCWSGNLLPDPPIEPGEAKCSAMNEADPRDWLLAPHGKELFAQTLLQQNGFATTLLLIE